MVLFWEVLETSGASRNFRKYVIADTLLKVVHWRLKVKVSTVRTLLLNLQGTGEYSTKDASVRALPLYPNWNL